MSRPECRSRPASLILRIEPDMNMKVLRVTAVALLLAAVGCQRKSEDDTALLRLGRTVLTRKDYGYFSSMARFFPLKVPTVFPAHRKTVTTMLETELLFRKTPMWFKRKVGKKTPSWEWREKYYHAQLYMSGVLVRNLSFTDAQIEQLYESWKEDSFKVVTTVKPDSAQAAAAARDSAGSPDSAAAQAAPDTAARDSVYYKSLGEVRNRLVKHLFLETYPPDSTYVQRYFGDSLPDSSVIREQWFNYMSRYIRNRDQDFFLNRFYKKYYGSELPDSMGGFVGEGKPVTPQDMEVVTEWLPEGEKARFETEQGQRQLARWVLRWVIYSRKARESGFLDSDDVRQNMAWVWKYHVVNLYVADVLLPKLEKHVTVDTALCVYSYWDEAGKVVIPPDSAGLAREIGNKHNRELGLALDSVIYRMRLRKGVTFLQNDYRDDKDRPPEAILARADSLRDTGSAREAEEEYRKLTGQYGFTDEGRTALAEVAKLVTEKENYRDAVRNYRTFLFETADSARMCNTFFMIGFIYDEYMNKPELAEVNYKWVLKNMPRCELADDAEFMMLHLDEPMIRIEDLRAEALRQGREIDYSEEDTLTVIEEDSLASEEDTDAT
jgi:hypothetical protein